MGPHSNPHLAPDELAAQAKHGRATAREQLLNDLMPLVVRITSQQTGRFVRVGQDEEISVALTAVNEAIDSYAPERGSFARFAQMVIRRRLADYYRRTSDRHTVPWSELEVQDEDGNATNPTLDRIARLHWQQHQEQRERRREIEEYEAILAQYGVTFDALTRLYPKHRAARDRALAVAYYLASQPHLVHFLRRQRMLPLQDLTRTFGWSRKAVERHRAFIIAATLILLHDWPYLREYVPPPSCASTGGRS